MDSSALFAMLLGPVLYATPHLLVCAVGLVLCLMRRPALGAAGTYACAGFGLFIFGSLLGLGGHAWLLWMRQNGDPSAASIAMSMGMFSAFATLLHTIAMGLLIAAILVRRPARAA
ncbi:MULTISPECIES: hypothetical protein [unclassified Lysobacter]|uniref:hypothetical protein n=1 Tax=unclassified Lysobacter TaxID=2635362 RepID=UPI0006F676BD|nr:MULTISPECIES: hypothetical protein [unclassified Lysobacter]KRA17219.1 hypothetical protein ASD69_10915 [Lysobacter sp. Root604]KRD31314.1 hypothetical protein ASE35_14990 [Lysobacter sp. Root916]